jgi:hypothetical protein
MTDWLLKFLKAKTISSYAITISEVLDFWIFFIYFMKQLSPKEHNNYKRFDSEPTRGQKQLIVYLSHNVQMIFHRYSTQNLVNRWT